MTEDWILMDAAKTQLASKGDGAVVLNWWKDRKGGDPIAYAILLDSGQELAVGPKHIEPET
ncbi:hypothetical protein J2S94_004118 [Arthrobacter bambusae]|nr:hypothetical protein [Arthrobacter bambusae]